MESPSMTLVTRPCRRLGSADVSALAKQARQRMAVKPQLVVLAMRSGKGVMRLALLALSKVIAPTLSPAPLESSTPIPAMSVKVRKKG